MSRSIRLTLAQEKMNESSNSIDFFWDQDDETDMPALRAVSMASLDVSARSQCIPEVVEEDEEPCHRRVRFSANIDCKPYIHLSDFTREELKRGFYTKDERAVMAASREDIIEKIDNGTNDEDECECIRGLEYYCVETSKDIDVRVDAVIDLVMDEQDDQIDENIFDEYTLSVAASYVTSESAEAARQMGAEDAKRAQEAYFEMVHNGSIGKYIMPSTLSTFEPAKKKKKSKRRSSSANKRKSLTSEDKKAKKKKEKKHFRSSSVLYQDRTADEKSLLSPSSAKSTKSAKSNKSSSSKNKVAKKSKGRTADYNVLLSPNSVLSSSTKSTKSTPSKSSKSSTKSKNSKKSKKEILVVEKSSSDTVATEAETVKPNSLSLSSDDGDTFLSLAPEKSSKNSKKKEKTRKVPSRRNTYTGPPPEVPDYESEDDNRKPERRNSWWDI